MIGECGLEILGQEWLLCGCFFIYGGIVARGWYWFGDGYGVRLS